MEDAINIDSIEIKSFDSIEDIDPELWDSILPPGDILNSFGYQKTIEKSRVNEFRYKYYLFFQNKELIAHVSTGILTFGLDLMADKGLKKFFSSVKKIFPSFLQIKLIECGHPTALGNTFVVREEKYSDTVVSLIQEELTLLARKEKTGLIAVRDVYTREMPFFKGFLDKGFKPIENMANSFFYVMQNSFDDYLSDLVAKRRREILHRLDTFYNAGCTFEIVVDFAPLSSEIYGLWHDTFLHAKEYQREILNEEYFRFMSDFLGDKSFVFLCRKDGRPIGFTMFLDAGDTLISTYCGLDYSENRKTFTYFVLFYKSIEYAINQGKKYIELGVTNYNPKIEIGAVPEPIYIYVKSLSPFFNLIFAPLMRMMNTSPEFNKRKIFNSRHFERYEPKQDVAALYEGEKYLVRDLSLNGFALEGDIPEKKNLSLKIIEDFHIPMKVELKNRTVTENGTIRSGFLIKKMSQEHSFQWNMLVQKFQVLQSRQEKDLKKY